MIKEINKIAKEAGRIIMNHYNNDNIEICYKTDSSPVSTADLESNDFICQELTKLHPEIPIISEESDNNLVEFSDYFWSIDPLDGTKAFLNRDGEFTVNIALIKNNTPILGIVYAPLNDQLYYVDQNNIPHKQSKGKSAIRIQTRSIPEEGATILISASSVNHTKLNQYLNNKKIDQIIPTSSALKICLIAEGKADFYPRFGQTMEWDTAAGHAILNAAGGSIKDLEGNHLTYGNFEKKFYNPEFIASGKS